MDTLNGYVTPEEVCNRLGLRSDDPEVIADIRGALLIVEEEVDQFCNTTLKAVDGATEVYNGSGTTILSLGKFCRSITSVGYLDSNNIETPITNYSLQPRPTVRKDGDGTKVFTFILLKDEAVFPLGLENIKVVGNFGLVRIPAVIKEAIYLGVKNFLDLRTYNEQTPSESGFGRSVSQRSPYSVGYLPEVAKDLLSVWKYRGMDD